MKVCLNKAGVALVLVLMIVVLSAGLLSAVMYYALSGTEISGLQRKYETSKEASIGAIDIFTKELMNRAITGQGTTGLSAIAASLTQGTGKIVNSIAAVSGRDACFQTKLTKPAACWQAGCDVTVCADYLPCGTCGTADIDTDPTVNPNITFKLLSASGSSRPFVVDLKIIDTSTGNSNLSGPILEGSGVVGTGSGMISTRHFPYLYTITTESKPQNSTTERANIEVLYAY